jgi:hypothetical protein
LLAVARVGAGGAPRLSVGKRVRAHDHDEYRAGGVMAERIAVPDDVAAMGVLERVDYEDAFTTRALDDRAPEEWARLLVQEAPGWLRSFVRVAQRGALGLRLGPADSPRHPLGWDVLVTGPDAVVLGVEGGLLTPRIVVTARQREVVACTLVRFDHPVARPVWAVLAPVHRAVARRLLDDGVRATTSSPPHRR